MASIAVPGHVAAQVTPQPAGPTPAPPAQSSFVPGSPGDEAAVRAMIGAEDAGKTATGIAPDLDWENAFGVRYSNLAKRDAFYNQNVTPQMSDATDSTLEVRVKFVSPDIAVADEYWRVQGQKGEAGPDRWGRTTYIFKKIAGSWTLVIERVADLRVPWYKHYDALPPAFPLTPQQMAAFAGDYTYKPGKKFHVAISGDRFEVTGLKNPAVAIPISATELLMFRPDDLAEYRRLILKQNGSTTSLELHWETGELVATAVKFLSGKPDTGKLASDGRSGKPTIVTRVASNP